MAGEAMGFGSDQLCDGGLIALRICCSRAAGLWVEEEGMWRMGMVAAATGAMKECLGKAAF